jgi:hypothetical protein
MSEQSKLDSLVSKIQGREPKSPHQLFAEKSQMLRWFHERDLRELKAMRAGFELMRDRKQKGGRA